MSAASSLQVDGEGIVIRDIEPDDRNFIIATWVRSYKPLARVNSSDVYEWGQRELIRRLLLAHRVCVACQSDVPSSILGWVCAEPKNRTVHYAFVRQELRDIGIARKLITEALGGAYFDRINVSHRFVNHDESRKRFVFNPYLLMVTP